MEPGNYRVLALQHDGYLIGPRITGDKGHGEYLAIARGKSDQFSFKLRPKVVAHGRIVDEATGKPVPDAIVIGEVLVTPVLLTQPERPRSNG